MHSAAKKVLTNHNFWYRFCSFFDNYQCLHKRGGRGGTCPPRISRIRQKWHILQNFSLKWGLLGPFLGLCPPQNFFLMEALIWIRKKVWNTYNVKKMNHFQTGFARSILSLIFLLWNRLVFSNFSCRSFFGKAPKPSRAELFSQKLEPNTSRA